MTNKEGKEALTARQILDKHYGLEGLKAVEKHNLVMAMEEFALLKVAEKDKEIEELKAVNSLRYDNRTTFTYKQMENAFNAGWNGVKSPDGESYSFEKFIKSLPISFYEEREPNHDFTDEP